MGIYVVCRENSNIVRAAYTNVQPEQMEPDGIQTEVEVIPLPDSVPGMNPVLMLDRGSNTLYYDYLAPDTIDVKIADLNQTLLLESANDKATISSLEDTVGSLLLEVAALKGGTE